MTKSKRVDAYQARLVVSVPLDLANAESYSDAVEAVKEISLAIPGATVEIVSASLVKVAAPVVPAAQATPLQQSNEQLPENAPEAQMPEFLHRKPPPKSAA